MSLYSEWYFTPEAESEAYLLFVWPESSVDKAPQEHRCTRRRGYRLATQKEKHIQLESLCARVVRAAFSLALLTGRPAHALLLALSGDTRALVRPRHKNATVRPLSGPKIALPGGGWHGRPAKEGGGVPEMGFRAGPFVLCKDGCCHQRRRNTNFGPENFFSLKKFSPHMCSQNDQRDVGIILSHLCWGRTPPPPGTAGRAAPAQTPLPARRPRRGRGGLSKWASVPSPPPPQSNFLPALALLRWDLWWGCGASFVQGFVLYQRDSPHEGRPTRSSATPWRKILGDMASVSPTPPAEQFSSRPLSQAFDRATAALVWPQGLEGREAMLGRRWPVNYRRSAVNRRPRGRACEATVSCDWPRVAPAPCRCDSQRAGVSSRPPFRCFQGPLPIGGTPSHK